MKDRERQAIPWNVLELGIPLIDLFVYKLWNLPTNRNAILSRTKIHTRDFKLES
ncbi:hypothetical protein WN51_11804 [Melipona quadrifasciata]|uniref:Uncharacterized protein n=1 Tax=Melipona quadrifasciata TaxID=166423 RepID=A0A0M9A567_9HYME|nr:hypothetical protein WN51_11804 [Melipona quadrifasciata]